MLQIQDGRKDSDCYICAEQHPVIISFLIQQLSGVDNSETKKEQHKVAPCIRITIIMCYPIPKWTMN